MLEHAKMLPSFIVYRRFLMLPAGILKGTWTTMNIEASPKIDPYAVQPTFLKNNLKNINKQTFIKKAYLIISNFIRNYLP